MEIGVRASLPLRITGWDPPGREVSLLHTAGLSVPWSIRTCGCRALAQAPSTESAVRLLKRVTTPVERPLHGALFDALGVTEEEAEASTPSPTNLAYMNHIEVSMDMGGLASGVAALLPCPRIYHEVGKILKEPAHPTYKIWQSSYAEGLLEASVAAWSEFVDELAEDAGSNTRALMEEAYLTSSRYEYMFWSMAYNMEQWPAEFGHNRFPGDSVADNANDARSNAMARRFTGTVNAPDFPTAWIG